MYTLTLLESASLPTISNPVNPTESFLDWTVNTTAFANELEFVLSGNTAETQSAEQVSAVSLSDALHSPSPQGTIVGEPVGFRNGE